MNDKQLKKIAMNTPPNVLKKITFDILDELKIKSNLTVNGMGVINLQKKIDNIFFERTEEYQMAIADNYSFSHITDSGTTVLTHNHRCSIYIGHIYYIIYAVWDSIDIYLNINAGNIKYTTKKPRWTDYIKYDRQGVNIQPYYSACIGKRRKNTFRLAIKHMFEMATKHNYNDWLIEKYPEYLI